MKNLLRIIAALLLLSTPAVAKSSISIGTTMSFLKIDDPNFKYINKLDKSLNLDFGFCKIMIQKKNISYSFR